MVGKSSLTYRFINYNTPKDHDPTIEDKYKTVFDIAGTSCEIGKENIYFNLNCRNIRYCWTRRLSRYARYVDKFWRRLFIGLCSK